MTLLPPSLAPEFNTPPAVEDFPTALLPMLTDESLNPWLRVLRKMGHGVLVCKQEGTILWFNKPLRRSLGLAPEALGPEAAAEGAQPFQLEALYPHCDNEQGLKLQDALARCVAEGRTVEEAFKVRNEGRAPSYFDVYMVPLHEGVGIADEERRLETQNKAVLGAVVVFRDITRIKTTEKMRRDFVANVSHELRTPLSVLKGYAESLLDGALETPELAREFVEVMERHAERLSCLVADLLDLSRLESPDSQMTLQPMPLKPLVERVMVMVQPSAEAKQISLQLQLAEAQVSPGLTRSKEEGKALPDIWGSPASLEQVFFNLVDNAVKYTPTGGQVRVTLKPVASNTQASTPGLDSAPPSSMLDTKKAATVMLQACIEDTGIGIDPKHFPRLFERFYRVDKARSRDMGGTGLGLAIVKHIVQAHGGSIWVESEPGQGSRFYFTLKTLEQKTRFGSAVF